MPPKILRKKLKNGFLILAEKVSNIEKMAAVCLGIKVGSVHEDENSGGIVHLVEHLAFKSQHRRPFEVVIKGFEHRGFEVKAGTTHNLTEFTMAGPSYNLSLAIKELYRAVTNIKYDSNETRNEKKQILGEILSGRDDLSNDCEDKLFKVSFRGSSYGRPIIGTPQSTKTLNRSKILKFKKAFFRPNNMVISVCGEFDKNELFRTIKKTFGLLRFREVHLPEVKNPRIPNRFCLTVVKKRKGIRSAYLCFAYLLPGFGHSDAPKFHLLNSIICKGQSCKIFLELIQKRGLGYEYRGELCNFGDFSVLFFVVQVAKPEKVIEAKKLALEEIKKLAIQFLWDVDGHKEWFAACFKREILGNIFNRSEELLESEIEPRSYDFRKLPDIISEIKPEELREAGRKYLNNHILLAIVPWGSRISKRQLMS